MTSDVNVKKSIAINKQIIRAEVKQMEKEMWERSRFCGCGADSVLECSCDKDKRQRYMRRVSNAINERYGRKAVNLMVGDNMMG